MDRETYEQLDRIENEVMNVSAKLDIIADAMGLIHDEEKEDLEKEVNDDLRNDAEQVKDEQLEQKEMEEDKYSQ